MVPVLQCPHVSGGAPPTNHIYLCGIIFTQTRGDHPGPMQGRVNTRPWH